MNVFITGITRGMGAQIAKTIAPKCNTILGTSKKLEDKSNIDKISKLCHSFHYLEQDLSLGKQAAETLASWAQSKVECIDCLILNAGFYIEGELIDISEKEMRNNLEVNFLINHFLVQALFSLITKSRLKRIIIIGSTAAYEPYPLVPTYGVAKWALRGLAVNLRKELARYRVGVTFVSPGATWTDMWEGEDLPRNRLLEPTDIAALIDVTLSLSEQAVVEEIVVRPMEGDFHE